MIPMTPLQSWALIVLMFVAMIPVVRLIIDTESAAEARRQASADSNDAQCDEEGLGRVEADEICEQRPQLVLVPSEADPGPTEVYDWAMQGI